jgi:alpha-amylase
VTRRYPIRTVAPLLLALMLLAPSSGMALAQATPGASPVASGVDWWQGATCYEIFVRSFSDSDGDGNGDLRGIVEKLDYLNDGVPGEGDDLGVTCIWLMPVMQSVSYHGYDVTDYETVEEDYGTNEDFLALMDAAHERGIRVIIDLPLNHTSVEHPWFRDAASNPDSPYRDWFIFAPEDQGYTGPWGQRVWHESPAGGEFYYGIFDASMPDLNYRNPGVNAEIERITAFWLTEMGVDGFRLDAVKHVIEDGQVQESTPETIQWLREFGAFIRTVKPEAYTVGEVAGVGAASLGPYYPDTLDQYFQFELAQTVVNAASFGNGRQLLPVVSGTVNGLPDQRFATFLTNHDQKRVGSQLGGDTGKLRVAGMLLLSLPGTAFIYYGEEIGMQGDKPDPRIRTPMQWSGDVAGGFTTGTPWEPLQPGWEEITVAAQAGDPASVLATYRAWGQLRERHFALRTGEYLPVTRDDASIVSFVRQTDEETLLVVVNLGADPTEGQVLTVPEGITGATTDLFSGEASAGIAADGTFPIPAVAGRSGTVLRVGNAGE